MCEHQGLGDPTATKQDVKIGIIAVLSVMTKELVPVTRSASLLSGFTITAIIQLLGRV